MQAPWSLKGRDRIEVPHAHAKPWAWHLRSEANRESRDVRPGRWMLLCALGVAALRVVFFMVLYQLGLTPRVPGAA